MIEEFHRWQESFQDRLVLRCEQVQLWIQNLLDDFPVDRAAIAR